MRRTFTALAAAMLAAIPLQASAAPPMSAADFAAKCSAGPYTVGFDLRVQGGTGTLTGDCLISIAEGVTLTFNKATIDGPHFFVVGNSLAGSTIIVNNATIDVGEGLQIAAGCCGGDGEPGHPEENGTAVVKNSTLRGSSVEVSGSTADDFGAVSVKNSNLEATSALGLRIRASVPATGGSIDVKSSTLTSTGDILIDTDVAGRTVVRHSTLTAPTVTITTGAGGTCVSSGNTPATACT